jgi:hypothetical protein
MGLLVGVLANLAKVRPARWGPYGWLVMLGISLLTALLGGWLGSLLLGRYVATAVALWVPILCVLLAPRLTMRINIRSRRDSAGR